MKRTLLALATAATVFGGSAAMAQPYGYYGGGGYHRDHDWDRDRDHDRWERRGYNNGYYNPPYGRAYGYYRGGYLPPQYRNDRYVVYDYRDYGWSPPPRGYAYYRTETGDVVMAAIASGIIGAVIGGALADHHDHRYYDRRW